MVVTHGMKLRARWGAFAISLGEQGSKLLIFGSFGKLSECDFLTWFWPPGEGPPRTPFIYDNIIILLMFLAKTDFGVTFKLAIASHRF